MSMKSDKSSWMASWGDQIPIDDGYENDDSSLNDLSQKSIATSITQYRYENGRRYHVYREGQYWAPNDEQANALDDIAHHMFLLTLNDKLFLAPLERQNPRRALDVGTGTGIWAQDFADNFPQTEIIATDLSPIQPGFAPPNLSFEIDDCCSEWVYPKNHFDYIHIRLMYGSVADWAAFYKEVYEHLAPGGYIEQAEISPIPISDDGSIVPGDIYDECGKLAIECGEAFGKTLCVQEFMKDLITQTGFMDVVETRYKWPIGPWSNDQRLKDLGKWNMKHWENGLEGWTMRFYTKYLHWTYDEVKEWNSKMNRALRDRSKHIYQDARVVVARKPL